MAEDILKKIINKKTERLINLKKKRPIESIKDRSPDSIDYVKFKDSIENNSEKPPSLVTVIEMNSAAPPRR